MAAEGEKKMITLKCSDGEEFEVEEAVAMESQTIRYAIEDSCTDAGIPLPEVNSKILSMVIEYCNKHAAAATAAAKAASDDVGANNSSASTSADSGEDLKDWDADFVKVDTDTLFDLIKAANYLNIKGLLDLTCQAIADMIKGKTPEEIYKTFNINPASFTPEEEEEIRRENQWAFEDFPTRQPKEENNPEDFHTRHPEEENKTTPDPRQLIFARRELSYIINRYIPEDSEAEGENQWEHPWDKERGRACFLVWRRFYQRLVKKGRRLVRCA